MAVPGEDPVECPSVQVAHGVLEGLAYVPEDPAVETLDAWVVCSSRAVGRLVHACLGADPGLGDHVEDPDSGLGVLETIDTLRLYHNITIVNKL